MTRPRALTQSGGIDAMGRLVVLLGGLLLVHAAPAQARSWPVDILRTTFDVQAQHQIDTPIEEIHQGCARRDCIPSIDEPDFVGATGLPQLAADDLILGLKIGDTARAYPAYILNYHEVVNDTIEGRAIAVTFCPLCGSGVAFERVIDGKVVELGVSGLLHNSDLVLYDRASQSLWQQITGEAISGPMRGQVLEAVPLTMVNWQDWRSAHPGTTVLAGVPGVSYASKSPYGDYEKSERLMFPARQDPTSRLHPKVVVHGVRLGPSASAAVTERALLAEPEIRMTVAGDELLWRRLADGRVEVLRRGSQSDEMLARRMFWFAWYSFNTDTVLRDR